MNLTSSYIDKYVIAWKKNKRRIWVIPPTSHKYIVHNLSPDFKMLLKKCIIKFIHNALNNKNMIRAKNLKKKPLLREVRVYDQNKYFYE